MRFVVATKHNDAKKYQTFFDEASKKEKDDGIYIIKIFDRVVTKSEAKHENINTFIIHTAKQENTDMRKKRLVKDIIKCIRGAS